MRKYEGFFWFWQCFSNECDYTQKGATADQPLSSCAFTAECSFRAINCGVSNLGIKVNNLIGFLPKINRLKGLKSLKIIKFGLLKVHLEKKPDYFYYPKIFLLILLKILYPPIPKLKTLQLILP